MQNWIKKNVPQSVLQAAGRSIFRKKCKKRFQVFQNSTDAVLRENFMRSFDRDHGFCILSKKRLTARNVQFQDERRAP